MRSELAALMILPSETLGMSESAILLRDRAESQSEWFPVDQATESLSDGYE